MFCEADEVVRTKDWHNDPEGIKGFGGVIDVCAYFGEPTDEVRRQQYQAELAERERRINEYANFYDHNSRLLRTPFHHTKL